MRVMVIVMLGVIACACRAPSAQVMEAPARSNPYGTCVIEVVDDPVRFTVTFAYDPITPAIHPSSRGAELEGGTHDVVIEVLEGALDFHGRDPNHMLFTKCLAIGEHVYSTPAGSIDGGATLTPDGTSAIPLTIQWAGHSHPPEARASLALVPKAANGRYTVWVLVDGRREKLELAPRSTRCPSPAESSSTP